MIGHNHLGKNGRFGNQMSQYAATRGIASNRGFDWCIPPGPKNENEFFDEENQPEQSAEGTLDLIKIKRIHKFLEEIGAKGIGETTVAKIYEGIKYKTVGDFINVNLQTLQTLKMGEKITLNIYESIIKAVNNLDAPTLMSGSKVFGRGLGAKKFSKVFETYPDFLGKRYTLKEYQGLFKSVEGFGDKTATLAAEGMMEFWTFVDKELTKGLFDKIIQNTKNTFRQDLEQAEASEATGAPGAPRDLSLKDINVYLTGTRDQTVSDLIKKLGGKIQASFTGTTNLLVKKDIDYNNKKTEEAEQKGIPILTVDQFIAKYSQ
jgi:NAD-dependent DNA ligase